MNAENNRRTSARRANDEFLRRMLGGESVGGARAAMNAVPMPGPDFPQERPNRPSCDGSYPNGGNNTGACKMSKDMPSLAMVYAPEQCWQNLLDPAVGLAHGSLFADLVLPFEGCDNRIGERNPHKRGGGCDVC